MYTLVLYIYIDTRIEPDKGSGKLYFPILQYSHVFRCDAEMRDKFGVSWKHAELPRMGRCIKEFVACSHSGQDNQFSVQHWLCCVEIGSD
jgi:hypothetical protein